MVVDLVAYRCTQERSWVLLGQFEAIPLKLSNAVTAAVVHFPDLHKGNILDYKMHGNTLFLELTNFNQVNQVNQVNQPSCLSKVAFHSTRRVRRSIRAGEEDNQESETLQDTSGL
jgi:hypothetical protein